MWNYETLAAQYLNLYETLSRNQNEQESIYIFRRECCALLQEIILNAEYAQDLKLCKLGMEIAANAAQTRICEKRSDGCIITRPDPCPQNLREICVKAYDKFQASVQPRDKMFIPPRIERTAPDAERSLSALRLYDLQKSQKNAERQASNKQINRLFGSRG